VTTVVKSKCAGVGPAPQADSLLRSDGELAIVDTAAAWERFAPQAALESTWGLIGATNAYLEQHAPWKMEPGPALEAVMGDALEAIRLVCVLATPAMPAVCEEIWRRIGLDGTPSDVTYEESARWGLYRSVHTIEKGEPLFPRIKSDQ
jgi:methionyl-tRNA synthetase